MIHGVEAESNVVVTSPDRYDFLTYKYSHSKTVYVEQPEFITRCINTRGYTHDKPVFKPMGGTAGAASGYNLFCLAFVARP